MTEQFLRSEIIEFLLEQDKIERYQACEFSTSLLCLIAAINDYSFSDDMINELPQFLPTPREINKYK